MYRLNCTAHEEHQLSEPTSNGCYMVDLLTLSKFFIVMGQYSVERQFFGLNLSLLLGINAGDFEGVCFLFELVDG